MSLYYSILNRSYRNVRRFRLSNPNFVQCNWSTRRRVTGVMFRFRVFVVMIRLIAERHAAARERNPERKWIDEESAD